MSTLVAYFVNQHTVTDAHYFPYYFFFGKFSWPRVGQGSGGVSTCVGDTE